jgi:hypothetical protein
MADWNEQHPENSTTLCNMLYHTQVILPWKAEILIRIRNSSQWAGRYWPHFLLNRKCPFFTRIILRRFLRYPGWCYQGKCYISGSSAQPLRRATRYIDLWALVGGGNRLCFGLCGYRVYNQYYWQAADLRWVVKLYTWIYVSCQHHNFVFQCLFSSAAACARLPWSL